MKFNKVSGQALVEYLLIFALIGVVAVHFVKELSGMMNNATGYLGSELTKQLSSGYCRQNCFYWGYKN